MRTGLIYVKNTILSLLVTSCFGIIGLNAQTKTPQPVTGAAQLSVYLEKLAHKNIAIVANQTSVVPSKHGYIHLVDTLNSLGVSIVKVFAPEHGFRGSQDAGADVSDEVDTKTGIPLISLHGVNRKPKPEHLAGIDLVVFDIQDVGVRFYTYIATLQLVMQACAEQGIPILVLDRPNPNAHLIDGPIMEWENKSFLGMTPVPLLYGMTIGEYALMLAGQPDWLWETYGPDGGKNGPKVSLEIIPLTHYTHRTNYQLPIPPSPNLRETQAVALYPSLGLFEGTTWNAGRGTERPFTQVGSPLGDPKHFTHTYIPTARPGATDPKHKDKVCYGLDLSGITSIQGVHLSWLIETYRYSTDPSKFFLDPGFKKHAGTSMLQQQIESGMTEAQIRETWQKGLSEFKRIRQNYLLYPER